MTEAVPFLLVLDSKREAYPRHVSFLPNRIAALALAVEKTKRKVAV
jgi:hypothetical protein